MKLNATPETLYILCAPFFTLQACAAIERYLDEYGDDGAYSAGDICLSFSELPAYCRDDYSEEEIIAELKNGNIVVAN